MLSIIQYFYVLFCLLGVFLWTQFQTTDPSLPAASQATRALPAVAYHSPNQRYLYIDPPQPGYGLEVGSYANIKVYSATPSYVPVKTLNYVVREGSRWVVASPFVSSPQQPQ